MELDSFDGVFVAGHHRVRWHAHVATL
jgi:hypothetical protein